MVFVDKKKQVREYWRDALLTVWFIGDVKGRSGERVRGEK